MCTGAQSETYFLAFKEKFWENWLWYVWAKHCLGTIHVWRGPLGRRIPIRSLGMSHSLWPHLACARVPENHLIIWFWKSHFISLKFCILVDVEQMFWLILVRLSKQSATPQTNRNVFEIVNQILGCGRIWTSNEQVISTII